MRASAQRIKKYRGMTAGAALLACLRGRANRVAVPENPALLPPLSLLPWPVRLRVQSSAGGLSPRRG